jgi:hypothetical protein
MLSKQTINSFKEAAKSLTSHKRRNFEAKITNEYLDGSARRAERIFNWGRKTVEMGQKELKSGIIYVGNFSSRGRNRMEVGYDSLEKDIKDLVENKTQTDPTFRTEKRYCKISAQLICKLLLEEKGYKDTIFKARTMNNILNRWATV